MSRSAGQRVRAGPCKAERRGIVEKMTDFAAGQSMTGQQMCHELLGKIIKVKQGAAGDGAAAAPPQVRAELHRRPRQNRMAEVRFLAPYNHGACFCLRSRHLLRRGFPRLG